jgi:serine protease
MRARCLTVCLLVLGVATGACSKPEPPAASTSTAPAAAQPAAPVTPPPALQKIEATPEAVAQANKTLDALADRDRRMRAALTFEEFEATVYKEPFAGGKYIVNGDTPIANRKQLREFFEDKVKTKTTRLAVGTVNGVDAKWNQQLKTKLTYCVSTTFGARHDTLVQQMTNATGEWQKVAAVAFSHDASQDANCTPANTSVVFDVRPVNVGSYLARAFFPNEPRAARNVLIDESSFELDPDGKLQLVGILRHELGHTIGFRHEQTRPEAGTCFEDNDWRPLTAYDAFSVMHYPQCNGKADWSLTLTDKDKSGSACLYGPAAGFTIDKTLAPGPCAAEVTPPPGAPKTESFSAQSVAKDAQKVYGPFTVAAGSQLEVAMSGTDATGDPDLYVRFDKAASVNSYDCRPYLDGPNETCAVTVPASTTRVFVTVRGYDKGTYDLRVTYVPSIGTKP